MTSSMQQDGNESSVSAPGCFYDITVLTNLQAKWLPVVRESKAGGAEDCPFEVIKTLSISSVRCTVVCTACSMDTMESMAAYS